MLQQTLTYLDALYRNENPLTGEQLAPDSVFAKDRIRYAISDLRVLIREEDSTAAKVLQTRQLNDEELVDLCTSLHDYGFSTSATQLTHILRGSRRVIDPRLRALPIFGKYRGEYAKAQIMRFCQEFAHRHPTLVDQTSSSQPIKTPKPWKNEPFFKKDYFDKLEEADFNRLSKDIVDLGLKRTGPSLPDFIAKIRDRLPRSFEPWTKAERALLLEAMCYTNDGEKLGRLFGRGAKAVTEEGKRLIYLSKKQHQESD